MKKLLLIAMLILFAIPSIALGAAHYVRAGAGGSSNGSDWTNAWTALPSNLIRGDTYYVAAGIYAAYDFDTPESGTAYIHVRKATGAEHGTEIGWSSAYGDGQALWQSAGLVWSIETDYWEIDGVVGSGNSGHGFGVNVTGTGGNVRGVRVLASNFSIRHTEIYSSFPCSVASGDKQDGIYINGAYSNVTVSYCYIHDWKRCGYLASGASSLIIEHSYVYHTYSTSGSHGQAVQLGPGAVNEVDIRYSVFKDTHGTGVIVYLDSTHENIRMYGNLFWLEEDSAACGIYSTSQAIGNTSGDTSNYCLIYNNTFIGLNGRAPGPSGEIDHNGRGTGNFAYNNIWYDSIIGWDSATAHDYNASDSGLGEANSETISSSIFTDYVGDDFTLASPTDGGVVFPSPFNRDMWGNLRGEDGVWDRGAFEYQAGGPVDETIPASPTGVGVDAF